MQKSLCFLEEIFFLSMPIIFKEPAELKGAENMHQDLACLQSIKLN